jgi:hypothetical protein
MSDHYRAAIDASAGPSLEGLLDGTMALLVRVRMFDGPGATDDDGNPLENPDVFTDLRPEQARDLALVLLAAAEDAETRTRRSNRWQERVR